MTRNLIVLGCTALLAVALGATSFAGSAPDTDSDGVLDPVDNCTIDPNGPLGGTCALQEDADLDGYGNACDTDTNNNNVTDLTDLSTVLAASKVSSTDPNLDFNCNLVTDLSDLSKVLADSKASKVPGPSCGNPSGTPCP